MKVYEKIANNKIAVLITGAHWIIVCAPLLSFSGSLVDSGGQHPPWGMFVILILIFDLPAIAIAMLICEPLYIFLGNENVYWYALFFISLFTITFQWLFLVNLASSLFSKEEEKFITLSLNDE
ncbi:MAG: hypothetical protein M3033_06765 [Acidobacteriota bacterium]|nr:hypothetical protein [Acidobacteriota bacterium]